MAYIANTPTDVAEMLAAIGVPDVEALFADIPEKVRLKSAPNVGRALSEYETLRYMRERADKNRPAAGGYLSFLGAGAYEHFIPSAVQAIAQRGEILTAYTPYQAEASQGTLQIIYEFQSMICFLTGLDVANASLYDGGSALAEAVLMAVRINGRNQIILPETLHPTYRDTVVGYTKSLGLEIIEWKMKDGLLDPAQWPVEANEPCALVIQQPNFFGSLEDAQALSAAAQAKGAVVIAVCNPMSLSALPPPGEWGADIAVGECQPIGLPLNCVGLNAGYIAAKNEHIRKMPGRIVGQTEDHDGRRGFVLTLQTREQHIRRERATSNICTNQGLCATMVTLWLALIGRAGFNKLGDLNVEMAARLREGLLKIKGVAALNDAPNFNEFTLRLPISAADFVAKMKTRGILAGLPASRLGAFDPNLLIVCATETKLESDIQTYLDAARAILE